MKQKDPPKWAVQFLTWYCNPDFIEEIEGDIYELFDRRILKNGPRMAKLKFVWDVIRFFRWSNIYKSNSKNTHMNKSILFKNYLKLGIRNIRKNIISSSINILGLAIAISLAITTFVFVDLQLNMDNFHENGERIYQMTNFLDVTQQQDRPWSNSPFPLGPQLAADNPSVEAYTRLLFVNSNIKYKDEVFQESITFVDPAYMEMFSFPIASGSKSALQSKRKIIISHDMAIKYFSYTDPIGKELSMKFSNGEIRRFQIGAVLKEFPYNASITSEIIVPIENFFDLKFSDRYDWSSLANATLIMLKEGKNIESIAQQYNHYIALQHSSQPTWKIQEFEAIPLTDLSLRDYQINSGISHSGGQPAARIALLVISAFLLSMACFNFMNISVAASTKRLKEIALRKVMGGYKKQLVSQFLVENILQCVFALVFGTVMAYFIFIPGFDYLIPEREIELRASSPISLIIFFISLLFFVGIASGTYPALYVSRFEPIAIFKGIQKFGSKNMFSKIMLGFQFFLATITIVACFVMTDQSIHAANRDWGYNPDGTLSVQVSGPEQYKQLSNEMNKHPDVISHTSSSSLIGRSLTIEAIKYEEKNISAVTFDVGKDFIETMQLKLKTGRPLTGLVSDQKSVMVNETFLAQMDWEDDPINKFFILDSVRHTIVGVLEDFHYDDFHNIIGPMVITGLADENVRYLSIKAKPEHLIGVETHMSKAWSKIAPNDSFNRYYQSDAFKDFYEDNNSAITILICLSSLAVILACLGLYGLLSFNIQKKLKEFSIRKVLGATPRTIAKIAARQYTYIILGAFILGAPLGAFGMKMLVAGIFPDAKNLGILPFLVAVIIIGGTLVLTVVGQIIKATKVNPADILRSE